MEVPVLKLPTPWTERIEPGEVVPTPTLEFDPSRESIGMEVSPVANEKELTALGIVEVADF